MTKFSSALTFSLLLPVLLFSQGSRKIGKGQPVGKPHFESKHTLNAPGCDTINIIPEDADLTLYSVGDLDDPPDGFDDGYVTGTNVFGDLQKANFFDVSATGNTYLSGVFIYFGYANGADLTKQIPIRVLDGTSGSPGAILGTSIVTLQEIHDSVDADELNEISFSPAVSLPTSKKFFISVDMSNIDWNNRDTLVIVGTEFAHQQGAASVHNAAWEQWDDYTWHAFSDADNWGDSLIHVMFPIISTNSNCSVITPVKMSSFSANSFGSANKLDWATVTESGSRGFEVQHSSDGVNFSTIGFVPTKAVGGNSSSILHYSYIDNAALPGNNYYRVKQIDLNSYASFTKTLLLIKDKISKDGILLVYPNPVKNVLNLLLTTSAKGVSTISVSNMAGITLMQKNIQTTGTNQNVQLNISALPKGTYFVKIPGEKNHAKFVKE